MGVETGTNRMSLSVGRSVYIYKHYTHSHRWTVGVSRRVIDEFQANTPAACTPLVPVNNPPANSYIRYPVPPPKARWNLSPSQMAAAAAAAVCQLYRARPALLTNALAVIDSYDCKPPARPPALKPIRQSARPPAEPRV